MSCWQMPFWMERYRTCIQTDGYSVEEGINRQGAADQQAFAIKRQVAMLIALRDAGALKGVKPSAWSWEKGLKRLPSRHVSKKFHRLRT